MANRILDFASSPGHLRVEYDQLLFERDSASQQPAEGRRQTRVATPLSDVAVVAVVQPQITCTVAALAAILRHGGAVIVSDRDHLPIGMMLPLVGHSTQAERFAAQAAVPTPRRKRLWQEIVRAKIRMQAATLEALHGTDGGLRDLAAQVRSGDPTNVEATAAQRYWPLLFDDPTFRRRRDAPDANRLLNYGYAVLRALVGRAICAAGLHPSLGIHHHNRYDAYALAADLMEPLRPIVDDAVVQVCCTFGPHTAITPGVKRALIEPLLGLYRANGEARTLFDWCGRLASGLAAVYMRESSRLEIPEGLSRVETADATHDIRALGVSPGVVAGDVRPAGEDADGPP